MTRNEDNVAADGAPARGDNPYRNDRLSRLRDDLFEIFKEINAMPHGRAGCNDENRAWDMSQLCAAYRAIDECDDFGGYYPRTFKP